MSRVPVQVRVIHCRCHQLLSRSCYLFPDILLVCTEGDIGSHTDSQFLYTRFVIHEHTIVSILKWRFRSIMSIQFHKLFQYSSQWRCHWGGQEGQSATPDSEKIAKNREKEGKIRKKRKNREEKAKIGKFLSLCPSWQIGLAPGLATLLIAA